MKRYLCLYFILICLISACGSTPTKVALQPSATLPDSTRMPTATATQRPTLVATLTKTPRPTATATVAPVTRTIEGQFDLFQALKLMYGPTTVIHEEAYGPVVEIPGKDRTEKAWENLVVSYRENGVNKYLVVTSRPEGDCHACFAFIDAAIFSQSGNRWQIDVNQKRITYGGSFGHIDKGRWVAIGPYKQGVLLTGTYCGQGGCIEETIIVTEIDGVFREVFRQRTMEQYYASMQSDSLTLAYTSHLQFHESISSEPYYELVVKQVGTDRSGKPLPEKSVYVFSNGKYELVTQP